MRLAQNEPDTLYVRMLGGFSIVWNGKLIVGGSKSGDSQMTDLLQILIHDREHGVPRDRLEDLLFGDREITNVHHALQSVIYNTKKKLERAGLPKVSYIEQRKNVFFWTNELKLVEDASEFETLCREAESAADKDEKLAFYLDAAHEYGGEFLPSQTSVIWAAQEARRLKGLFCRAVEQATELLRENQDFFQMEELGMHASRIDPLADWETVTMEALVSLGRFEEAHTLYDDTVQFYFNEQGLKPSRKMLDQFYKLGTAETRKYAAIDAIQSELTGMNDTAPGGYLCNYTVFVGIYRMVERMMERGGQSVYLMLCTIVDGKGNPMREGAQLEELTKRMGDALRHSIRRGDAMCQYGKGQYLALLVNTTRENCGIVQKRINDKFIAGRQRSRIKYYVNSMFWQQPASLPPAKPAQAPGTAPKPSGSVFKTGTGWKGGAR